MATKISLPLNSIGTIVGFIGTISVVVTAWNDANNKINQHTQWIADHVVAHKELDIDRKSSDKSYNQRFSAIEDKLGSIPNIQYRIAQVEASLASLTARLDKSLSDISSDFNEQRKEIGEMSTQIELSRQILQRIEDKIGSGKVRGSGGN